MNLTEEEFENLVIEGVEQIPLKFRKLMENISICIDDNPKKLDDGRLLLGLYQGIPRTHRGHYTQAIPDKITIFKSNIEKVSKDKEDIKRIVARTVWHEIAHHFGINEEGVRKIENNH